MRITYRTLAKLIARMSDEQLDCDVTVEDGINFECYPARLRIAGDQHDSLYMGHPIIYFDKECEYYTRSDDVEKLASDIGLK